MKNNDTWIIFGTSPYINKIFDKIPYLLEKYHNIGLNGFPMSFTGVEHWMFGDSGIFTNMVKPNYKGQKIIAHRRLDSELKTYWFRKTQCLIQNNYIIKPHYIFTTAKDFKPVLKENGSLLLMKTIATAAINYALLNDAKKIILVGIDLNQQWDYFNDVNRNPNFIRHIDIMREYVYKFKPYVRLYKINPESTLDLDYLKVEDL